MAQLKATASLSSGLLARKGQSGLKTFAVGFDAVNGVEGDEFAVDAAAVDVAQREGHRHLVRQLGVRGVEGQPLHHQL